MDEKEFDALMRFRPFGTADAMRWEAQGRADTEIVMTLGSALWGKAFEDVHRQLLAPHPEIPPGFDLSDYCKLLRCTERMVVALARLQRLRGLSLPGLAVFAGPTLWEARREIVRRAIDYLESR